MKKNNKDRKASKSPCEIQRKQILAGKLDEKHLKQIIQTFHANAMIAGKKLLEDYPTRDNAGFVYDRLHGLRERVLEKFPSLIVK